MIIIIINEKTSIPAKTAMLWSIAAATIMVLLNSRFVRNPECNAGNLIFRTPKDLSITFLARIWCLLKRSCAGVLAFLTGVNRKREQAYPWSPSRIPLISWFCNFWQRRLLLKICESWVDPDHLATMFLKIICLSQTACTFIDGHPFLLMYLLWLSPPGDLIRIWVPSMAPIMPGILVCFIRRSAFPFGKYIYWGLLLAIAIATFLMTRHAVEGETPIKSPQTLWNDPEAKNRNANKTCKWGGRAPKDSLLGWRSTSKSAINCSVVWRVDRKRSLNSTSSKISRGLFRSLKRRCLRRAWQAIPNWTISKSCRMSISSMLRVRPGVTGN